MISLFNSKIVIPVWSELPEGCEKTRIEKVLDKYAFKTFVVLCCISVFSPWPKFLHWPIGFLYVLLPYMFVYLFLDILFEGYPRSKDERWKRRVLIEFAVLNAVMLSGAGYLWSMLSISLYQLSGVVLGTLLMILIIDSYTMHGLLAFYRLRK